MNRNTILAISSVIAALVSGVVASLPLPWLRIGLSAFCGGIFFFGASYLLGRFFPASANPGEQRQTDASLEPVEVETEPGTLEPSGPEIVVPADSRLAEYGDLLVECSSNFEQISSDLTQLHDFVSLCRQSNETLQGLSVDSRFIQQNAQNTYSIADNLAKATDPAFALAGEVQETVAKLGDELAISLSETEILMVESGKISQILVLMNEISSKTHVLSINASIVAARAGVHGHAFDVVAREIRHLAQGTEESLKGIENLIHQLQERIQKVASRTRDTSAQIIKQKDALLSVAGVLQGVILSVEVIRTTSSVSSEKAEAQEKSLSQIIKYLNTSFTTKDESESDIQKLKALNERIYACIQPKGGLS